MKNRIIGTCRRVLHSAFAKNATSIMNNRQNCTSFSERLILGAFAVLAVITPSQAQIVAYDNLSGADIAGYSEPNGNNPIFGDFLTLSQSGVLSWLELTLFNSGVGGNIGYITNGTMVVRFYDNTVPYAGGAIVNPLLGEASVTWDFTGSGGLPPGAYSPGNFDLAASNIVLTRNILITQQFTETSGTSTRNGVAFFNNATVGSSPADFYLESTVNPEGFYTVSTGQVGYQVGVIPDERVVSNTSDSGPG